MPPGFRLYQAAEAKGVEDQVDEPPQVGQEEEQGEEELRELRIADGEPHFGAEESQRCMRWERSGTEAECFCFSHGARKRTSCLPLPPVPCMLKSKSMVPRGGKVTMNSNTQRLSHHKFPLRIGSLLMPCMPTAALSFGMSTKPGGMVPTRKKE
ncbi:hypothetical protein GW17_00045919 [Ensete ventricosum]|nr:hypothetical protein GW17_00045919 [Ensete ventricosum]